MHKKILLSAFVCDPTEGSEPSYGWNWATGIAAQGFEVFCITRKANKPGIQSMPAPPNVTFIYISLPFSLEKLYSHSIPAMYAYYMLWQRLAYAKAKSLCKKNNFHRVHHVTWGSFQMGSYLYKLNVPFIFGPAGGGQTAPVAFKKYFLNYWASEVKREKVSAFLQKYNPAFKNMLRKAYAIIVSNNETYQMVQAVRKAEINMSLDAALPQNFGPVTFQPKQLQQNRLQLLWTGRFMARKGLLLTIDVMNELKDMPGITLTIVGDGEMRSEVEKKIAAYQLENVELTGRIPYANVKEYYASHDVFFFSSLRDSCPAQLIEAMRFGMPVVTLNLHGQAMIVNDDTGIRCKCDTPEVAVKALADAIKTLYNNFSVVAQMSKAAYEFAKEQTWENKISQTISLHYT